MNLIIDIGNTIAKMAVFDGGRIVEVVYDSNLTLERLPEVCRTYTIEKAIVATVIDLSREVLSHLEDMQARREHLAKISASLRTAIRESGVECPSESHIIPLVVGANEKAIWKALQMQEHGL